MAKNIVILFDGTSNDVSEHRTNILRLYGALEKGPGQVVWYTPGVGTIGAENAWSRNYRKALELWGAATGWLLDLNVKNAYRFLVANYYNGKPDRWSKGRLRGPVAVPLTEDARDAIWIFGFSRGAYSARVLAGFIHAVGLIHPDNLNLLDAAFAAYKRAGDRLFSPDAALAGEDFGEVRLFERILAPDRPPIRCLGLFDTVASVIEWGRFGPRLRWHPFVSANVSVQSVRHAVAVHERRALYRAISWTPGGEFWGNPFTPGRAVPQDVKEVWFPGVHADVGGGYAEAESGLAKLPLDWMIDETRAMGLEFNTQTVNRIVKGKGDTKYVAPDAKAARHEQLKGAWWLLEYLPRFRRGADGLGQGWLDLELPRGRYRPIRADAVIDPSVGIHSRARDGGVPPPNLPGLVVPDQ